ncbi:MAG: LCP family protein, partial [Nocardioidaceae bacterium]|nr:LCP family protein [Nocardioidaceae bacterium]
IAHISADRKDVQLVSIPRDTWVPIEDYPGDDEHAKINAAFAYGGPSLAVKTVQDLTGIPIDHVAIIDWAGFKDLTTALGGVRVYIPETFYDTSQRIEWPKGWHEYEGQQALAYVRTRYNLPDESGDFGRIARQQNFMRATMSKLLSAGTMTNPIKLVKVINTLTKYLTVDETWDNGEIRSLALSMRGLGSDQVEFLTAPLGRYDYVGEQSIVRLAPKQSEALFDSLREDDIDSYLDKYPKAKLDGEQSIS